MADRTTRNVMITGASTGIGKACALHLEKLGFKVFAGVRQKADGLELVEEGCGEIQPVILDVTDPACIASAAQEVEEAAGSAGLDGLVNNAGIVVSGPMEFVPIEELRTQLEVNVIGPIAVTQAFLPLLRIARGRIVNMSSVSGVVAFPFMGPYAASKHALEALSDSMRVELAPWEIQVSVIEPASVFTPIWEKGLKNAQGIWDRAPEEAKRLYGARLTKLQDRAAKMGREGDSPQVVADAVEHALCARRPRTRYPVARGARAASILAKVVPDRLRDKLFSRELS